VPRGVVVVTDEVQDPGNLGTIVRSAEAAGAVAVIVGRGSQGVDPWNPKVVRGSAGAILGLPVLAVDEPASTLVALRGRGFRAVGAAADADAAYTDVDLTGPVAIVIGSESHGIGPALAGELDATVVIPMAGPTESLNAAVAASILLFEAARQARTGPGRPSRA
jgi:TrmH family RNA methyltransferase